MSGPGLAAAIRQFGGPEQLHLRELPLPAPGRGQIVVRVKAASVNPIDTRRRAGYGRRLLSVMGAARLPLVLGNDFAGTVCAVGRGVTAFREGDAVFGAMPPSSQGSHATHVAVDAALALHQPRGVAAEQLAALPYNFLTVSRALAGAGVTRGGVHGREVLVHGASGGLGLIALRMLHAMGARVTAVAGKRREACRLAGAASVLDRHATPLRALPRHFAATLNFASWDDEPAVLGLLAPGALGHATTVHPLLGRLDRDGLAGGTAGAWLEKRRMAALAPAGARYAWTVFRPDPAALAQLADFAQLQQQQGPSTDVARFALARAAEAHRHVELRLQGRAILLPHMT
ncbi:alcohol dehydrogenase catalytic domain-containing protein [Pseudoduganella namucuonensis]|uniref:NADPH:quinone reductase n=1 Tax=Pseudoduganella namucuonensis TaxID=1035707 RepID=A0A1I7LN54_9BURK|nr:alcohol dehydrogenase catalytic domain-containing protein [Pseudoduganella namucuonensis]SFV11050.1 NADPH:quinone reductase [Pseudoduganella namucuonensis]